MNKGNAATSHNIYSYILSNITNKYKPKKQVYIVKYSELHYTPTTKRTDRFTYELLAFEELNVARECMDSIYKTIINLHTLDDNFKADIDIFKENIQSGENTDPLICERRVKLFGNKDTNKGQTKLYIISIEIINELCNTK